MTTAGIGQQRAPSSSAWQHLAQSGTTNASKAEGIGLQSFASSAIFTWLSPTDYHFFRHLKNFLQGKCFHNQQEIDNSKSSSNSEAWIYMLQNWTNIISRWQNLLIIMVLISSNKDMFESSYNELKFTVQNCNYFFTNLITGHFLKRLNIELPCDPTVPSLVIFPGQLKISVHT